MTKTEKKVNENGTQMQLIREYDFENLIEINKVTKIIKDFYGDSQLSEEIILAINRGLGRIYCFTCGDKMDSDRLKKFYCKSCVNDGLSDFDGF